MGRHATRCPCSTTAPLDPSGLIQGMRELVAQGLVVRDDDTWLPSASLQRLAADWRLPLPAVAHELTVVDGDQLRAARHLVAIRGDGPIWTLDYTGLTSATPRIEMRGLSGADYLEGLAGMLRAEDATLAERGTPAVSEHSEPPPPPSVDTFCRECGTPIRPGSRFCTSCGRRQELAARGESPALHRDGRCARLARRDEGAYRQYLTEKQRSQAGCSARRMQWDFHHGLLGVQSPSQGEK